MGAVYTQLSITERRKIERRRYAKVAVDEMARVAALATSALTMATPVWADDSYNIIDEPLELTIQMHWDRS